MGSSSPSEVKSNVANNLIPTELRKKPRFSTEDDLLGLSDAELMVKVTEAEAFVETLESLLQRHHETMVCRQMKSISFGASSSRSSGPSSHRLLSKRRDSGLACGPKADAARARAIAEDLDHGEDEGESYEVTSGGSKGKRRARGDKTKEPKGPVEHQDHPEGA